MGSSMLLPTGQPGPMRDGEYVPAAPANQVSFQTKLVTPPNAVYIQLDDSIGVFAISSVANEVLVLTARFLRASDGQIINVNQSLPMGAVAYTKKQFNITLAEGWLLGVSLRSNSTASTARCLARVYFQRGANAATPLSSNQQLLFGGYVDGNMPLAWPGGPQNDGRIGPGYYYNPFTSPAQGAEISAQAKGGAAWRIIYLAAKLVASATAANRQPQLQFNQLGNAHIGIGTPTSQTAGQTVTYLWQQGASQFTMADGTIVIPLPAGLVMSTAGQFVGTHTFNMDTTGSGDQWTVTDALVEEVLAL